MSSAAKTVIILLVLAAFSPAHADGPQPFGPRSMQDIENRHAGEPFLVVIWATDCPPCRKELALLSSFTRDHPGIPLVLIASDNLHNAALVQQILSQYALTSVESWLFADSNIERLRYTIDPEWSGEIPRSYLYDTDLHRAAVSGALTSSRLSAWTDSLQ
jgi:thiol-disulfide isomerase/thioredoxin